MTVLSFLLLAGSACATETYSAKAMFFGEDDSVITASTSQKGAPATTVADSPAKKPTVVAAKKPATKSTIGASYFIRLKNPDGSTSDVLASRKFKSGERFQLGVKVNTPSYIAIYNEDPHGKITQIYPQPGRDNFVNAMGVVFLPSQGSFEFDQQPGTEQLLVYVSPKPIQSGMTERVRQMRPDVITADAFSPSCNSLTSLEGREFASKAINFTEDSAPCSTDAAKPASETYASKGIAFTDDPAPTAGGQVASYVVKARNTPDANLFLKIKLAHH